MADYSSGDKVSITTVDEKIEGIFLERSKLFDDNIVSVKLDSGYNMGIGKDKIKSIKLLEKRKQPKQKRDTIKFDKNLPTISVLSFGGTISSKIDYSTGGVYADYSAEDFVSMLPEIKGIANIKARKVAQIMSEDMGYEHWKTMAETVVEELNSGVDGVVITQGTDTMHYSAAAMSFFISEVNKPVVFTASQRSIDRGSSDAFMNLLCSIRVAAEMDIAEVVTCMHATSSDNYCSIIRGTKVRKMHTSRRDAFKAINSKPIANVFPEGKLEIIDKNYKRKNQQTSDTDCSFEKKVALIHVYPDMDSEILDYYIKKGYKGIVIAATALGHVPTESSNSLLPFITKAKNKEIAIVIASQTLYGSVHPYVYTNLRRLSIENNCIFVRDMIPETAYIKLSWVLGKKDCITVQDVKSRMLRNISGEISERTEYNG